MPLYTHNHAATLSDIHKRMLFTESAIDRGVALERGYYTARTRSEVPECFADYQRKPGLVIPMFSPDGETVGYQLRPDKPRKNGPKYETPHGISPVVDVHPRMLEEARHGTGPLLVTEGCKTGDAGAGRDIPTVVLAGVWMFCVPGEKPYRLKACFDYIRLEGREVFVCFDSDCMTKAGVQDALAALVAALEGRGAVVRVIYLPDAADGSKQGLDDFFAAGGTVKEMFVLARDFSPADIGGIRMSRDEKLRAAVEDLHRRWWSEGWKGRGGHSERDVALKIIEAAPRSGRIHRDGLRVEVSWGKLQVEAKVSRRTLSKALARLEARGFVHRDNKGRKADKTGAFVMRAKVDQGREGATQETQELQACNRGGLPLRGVPNGSPNVPRLRWSQPKFTPKRGTVAGTHRVRNSKPPQARDRIERLGKIRGAVVDALEVSGGTATVQEIAAALHRPRARDLFRRRRTAKGHDGPAVMLEEAGIIECENDVVTLAADWRARLDDARETGGEIEADALAEDQRKRKSRGYHNRDKPPVSKPSGAGLEAVRRSREKSREHRRENLVGWVEAEEPAKLSPLAEAVRAYLERNPRDGRQPPGWLGNTLWALELFDGHPTPAQTRAALEELGGARYLDGRLKQAQGVA